MRLLITSAVLVVSCQSAAAQDVQIACIADISTNPKYAPLSEKMAVGASRHQTFEMLANSTKATKADKPLIAAWATDRQDCFDRAAEQRATAPLAVQSLLARLQGQLSSAAADLYNGLITYGEFAKKRTEYGNEYTAGYNQAKEAYERDRQNQMQAQQTREEQRRQAAAAAILSRPAVEPYQLPMPTPARRTNCTTYGNQTDCTTR
jgi:hypothetical protein